MNKYYSENNTSYFDEPGTSAREINKSNIKDDIDCFEKKIVDSRYSVKRPTAKILGHVRKQD